MAEIMDIPVVIADIWIPKACKGDTRYKDYKREFSDACVPVSDIKELNNVIEYQLEHPEMLKQERSLIGIIDGGIGIKDPVGEIIKVIKSYENHN